MSNSESSSSEVRINYQDSKGQNLLDEKKPQSSDTDYYFNMIANPSKVIVVESESSSSSEFNQMMKDTETDSSTQRSSSSRRSSSSSSKKTSESRSRVETINITHSEKPPKEVSPKIPQYTAPTQPITVEQPKQLSPQEIRMKKIELLRKLSEIKTKGYKLTKEYDFNSSLEEMEYEYDLLRSFADKRNGVKVFRNGLLQAASVIEFLNDRYDPFDFHLTGWSDHMAVEIDSWEDVLEELYEKYKGSGKKMAPEVKLLYLIIASAGAFHFTKTQAAKVPGLDSMLAANPGLVSGMINGNKKKDESQFVSAQELNIQQQKEELKRKDTESRMRQQQMQQQQMLQQQQMMQQKMMQMQQQLEKQQSQQDNMKFDTSSSINNILNSQIFGGPKEGNPFFTRGERQGLSPGPVPANSKPLPNSIPTNQLKTEKLDIRPPEQVKDILSRIHTMRPSNTETQDETSSNNDRLISETTLSDSNPRKRQQRRKKTGIVIE
jgi:hypothetical protein